MPVVTNPSVLAEVTLFRGLTLTQLSRLNEMLRRSTAPAGTTFITAEQPSEVVYVISKGTVKTYIRDADGNEVILAILMAGEVIGEMCSLDSAGSSISAVTLEQTTLFWMDRASFQECLRAMLPIQHNLSRLLSHRLRLANERIQSLALQDVEGRVAHQVLAFAELYGQASANGEILIPIRLTQRDLASLVGATRERVNQVMSAYKRRQYISVDQRHRITVRNYEALSRRAHRVHRRLGARAMVWGNRSCPCGEPSCVKIADRLPSVEVQIF